MRNCIDDTKCFKKTFDKILEWKEVSNGAPIMLIEGASQLIDKLTAIKNLFYDSLDD